MSRACGAIAERTGETVLGAALCARSGAMGAVLGGEASRLAFGDAVPQGMAPRAKIEREGAKATRLPTSFLVAVTPDNVHVFTYRNGYFSTKVKKHLGTLPRQGMAIEIADQRITKQFHLSSAGQDLRFEMNHHRVTREFAELLQPGE
jgi:hypothetical protein